MKEYLILRLRNAAIAMDRKGDPNMAALLTEAVEELETALSIRATAKNFYNSTIADPALKMSACSAQHRDEVEVAGKLLRAALESK